MRCAGKDSVNDNDRCKEEANNILASSAPGSDEPCDLDPVSSRAVPADVPPARVLSGRLEIVPVSYLFTMIPAFHVIAKTLSI